MAAATFAGFLNSATNSIVSASAALSKPTISSSYVISSQNSIPIQIGIWKVERAVHHSNGKEVSIWTVDKSSLNGGGRNGNLKAEKNIEVVRKEVRFEERHSVCGTNVLKRCHHYRG